MVLLLLLLLLLLATPPPLPTTWRLNPSSSSSSTKIISAEDAGAQAPLSVTAAEVADAHLPSLSQMQGLRLPICDSCISSRGSFASAVTTGEVAEAQAPKLRQQLELRIRRGRNCQTTGGRIVRKHCKYRGTRRCCQEGLNTPKT